MRKSSTVALAIALSVRPGFAAGPDVATASALFERGISESAAGRYETGCAAFEASYQVDPQLGALFAAAQCQSQWGKIWSAVRHYRAYVAAVPALAPGKRARQGDRPERALAALARLQPLVPSLRLTPPEGPPGALEVWLDGVLLPSASYAQPLPAEVGLHRVETRAPGASPWSAELLLEPGETEHVQLALGAPLVPATETAAPSAAPVVARAPLAPAAAPASAPSALRIAGWSAAGLGATGLVLASVSGVLLLSQKAIVDEECAPSADSSGKRPCTRRGLSAVQRAENVGTVADVGLGVGVAGLAAAAVLLFVWPDRGAPAESSAGSDWHPWCAAWNQDLALGVQGHW